MGSVRKISSKSLRRSKGPKVFSCDSVLVFYQGTLLKGEQFDANFNFSTFEQVADRDPFQFNLGVGEVIQGWDIGLPKKRIGSVFELTIPAKLAYGERELENSSPPTVR